MLATLQQLASFQQWEEAISFLEQQPAAVHENDAVRSVLSDLREANDQEVSVLRATGIAYTALHRADMAAARQQAETMRQVKNSAELTTRLANMLETRVTQLADQVVANALSEARQALRQHNPKRAIDVLVESSDATNYSTLERRQNWQHLRRLAGRAKLLGCVGIRISP